MKLLYLNNKRVDIAEGSYFPFSYTISDNENVTIIGTPVSKTIKIPRTGNNDEIFGYIGDLNRVTIGGNDNLICISFNQTKKATYDFYNESELVSTGLLVVESVNDSEYSITLYDEMIDKLESLSTSNLNDLDIILSDNSVFNLESTCQNVNMLNLLPDVKPTFNNKDFKLDSKTLRCTQLSGSTYTEENAELPQDCTSLSMRTFKNYEVDYAIPLTTVIRSINRTNNSVFNHNSYPSIVVENDIQSLFDEVHLLCNEPKNNDLEKTLTLDMSEDVNTETPKLPLNVSGTHLVTKNGNYYIEWDYQINFQIWHSGTLQIGVVSENFDDNGNSTTYYNTSQVGTYIGSIWVDTCMKKTVDSKDYWSTISLTKVDMIWGVNTSCSSFNTGSLGGYVTLTIQGKILLNYDFFGGMIGDGSETTYLDVSIMRENPDNSQNKVWIFGQEDVTLSKLSRVRIKNTSIVQITPIDFRTGDLLKGQNLFPKIPITDFLINTAKYFNLAIIIKNGNIVFSRKKYYKTNELLIMDTNPEVQTNLISYSQLKLTTQLSENDLLKNYETNNQQVYGEQLINTGYSIKKSIKEVNFNVSIPFLLKDTNTFSYDRCCKYFNGGYSLNSHGDIKGFAGKISFGYLKQNSENLVISDDVWWETGGYASIYSERPIEKKFVMRNPAVVRNLNTEIEQLKWYYDFNLNASKTDYVHLTKYFTFSPYLFNGNTVAKSLELNKPLYNFANIIDSNYPVTNTAYYKYQRNMLIDKLSVNTHVLKAKIYIDGKVDIFKIYNYKGSWYVISKINEYDPTIPSLYEVELMKINNPDNYINNIII
jgi:hypothetical protein